MANTLVGPDLTINAATPSESGTTHVFVPAAPVDGIVPNRISETTSFTNNYPPTWPSSAVTGVKATSFKDDFYYKIRYLPAILDIGAITGGQEKDLFAFNGFFEDKTLEAITITNPTGIDLAGAAPPTVFSPLALEQYVVSIAADGPATIDSAVNFDWEVGVNDGSVQIVGIRIVVYPYFFNQGTVESLQWKTQVMTANDGGEQRIRVRNSPRQSFAIDTFINRSDWTLSSNLLYAWRGNIWGVPVFSEFRNITGPVSPGDLTIDVNTDFGDFRQGGLALLYTSYQSFEVVQIVSFTQIEITVSQIIANSFPTGTMLMPVVASRMTGNPIRQTNAHGARVQTTFESIDNVTLSTSPSVLQYNGLDVFVDDQLVIDEFAPDTYERRVDIMDTVSSNVEVFSPWNATKISRKFNLIFDNQESLWNFRLFLHRRAGKLLPFWAPTFETDFKLLSTGLIINQIIVVNEQQNVFAEDRVHIGIFAADSWTFAEIDTFAEVSGDLVLNLVETLNIQAEDIKLICYIGIKRLASDKLTINHGSNFTSSSNVPMIEVEQ